MIAVKNVYYMLAYAFSALREEGYAKLGSETFENSADLCAAILVRGISIQIKRGLNHDYLEKTETLSTLRGSVDIAQSIRTLSMMEGKLVCTYDDFLPNSYLNRILKTTMAHLLHSDAQKQRKRDIRGLLNYFSAVDTIPVHSIDWNFRYNRNNQSYILLISICRLALDGMIQNREGGRLKMIEFNENQMSRLYERFIFEYFNKEFPLLKTTASHIEWAFGEGSGDGLLPSMRSDVMLEYGDKVLIIDAKYYGHSLGRHFVKESFHSGNLYQIFAYVKNRAADGKGQEVSGMLLYARTEEEGDLNSSYNLSGNRIGVRTLDLNQDFAQIRAQLDGIAEEYFHIGREA